MTIEKQIENFEQKPIRTLFKWAMILCLIGGVFSAWHYATMPAKKVVERQVLVNSHQYIEGMEQRAAILRANIAEIDAMLSLDPENKDELLSQKRALRAQLNAITIQQNN